MITFSLPSDEHVIVLVVGMILLLNVAAAVGNVIGQSGGLIKHLDRGAGGWFTIIWLMASVVALVVGIVALVMIFFRGVGVS